jgi:hypothetical protein
MLEKRSQMMLEQAKADGAVSPAEEKFIELMKHESFVREFSNCTSFEAAKELLERNGVDMPMEELQNILTAAANILIKLEENNGELTDEDLEQVAGGWTWGGFFKGLVMGVVVTAVIVAVAAAAIATSVATGGTAAPLAVVTTGKVVAAVAGAVGMVAAGGAIGGVAGGIVEL